MSKRIYCVGKIVKGHKSIIVAENKSIYAKNQ